MLGRCKLVRHCISVVYNDALFHVDSTMYGITLHVHDRKGCSGSTRPDTSGDSGTLSPQAVATVVQLGTLFPEEDRRLGGRGLIRGHSVCCGTV